MKEFNFENNNNDNNNENLEGNDLIQVMFQIIIKIKLQKGKKR